MRCPFAEWNPTGATPGGWIKPRVAILHVIDGEGDARPHSGLEWHFEIFYDGRIQQQVDTGQRADANYQANDFAISIETEGLEHGEWTPAQIHSIVRLLRWLNEAHGIPLTCCESWDGEGVGFHTMWGAPSKWTPVAKSCPGPNRKQQFWDVIVPALTAPEDDMTPAEFVTLLKTDPDTYLAIAKIVRDVLNEATGAGQESWAGTAKATLAGVQGNHNSLMALLARSSEVDAVALAESLAAELGDDLARELGEALVRGAG